ncbi:MAG: hypothetical protein ISS29_05240 [Candidatus Marinimicrobia bacterium]|nr:hypothetical protein [Candidatus Neomarinimicrobiota bacterium]
MHRIILWPPLRFVCPPLRFGRRDRRSKRTEFRLAHLHRVTAKASEQYNTEDKSAEH